MAYGLDGDDVLLLCFRRLESDHLRMPGSYRGGPSPQNKVALAQVALYVIVAPSVFLLFIWPKRFRTNPTCLLFFLFSLCESFKNSTRARGSGADAPRISAARQ